MSEHMADLGASGRASPSQHTGRKSMTSCPKMVDAGRRKFLSGAGLAAAGMAAATVVPSPAESAPAPARVEYPSNRLANVRDLKVDEPANVSYPDRDAPGVLLKLGKRV